MTCLKCGHTRPEHPCWSVEVTERNGFQLAYLFNVNGGLVASAARETNREICDWAERIASREQVNLHFHYSKGGVS